MKETLIKNILGEEARVDHPVLGGMMNQSFLVENKNKLYILYLSTEQANEMVDRALEKENIDIVYNLGITSKNIYFDVEKGIKINEYIRGLSLDKEKEFDYQKVAEIFKILHSSSKLSKDDYQPFKRFLGYEKEAKSYVNDFEKDYLLLRNFLFKERDYLESQKKVLSHNDAQRSNIIKGDDGHYYLIDFEFMGNNDEIYDIACFANNEVQEGYELLKHYFNPLTYDHQKRFYLWRIFISLQWYLVALIKHYRGEGEKHGFNFLDVAKHFLNNALLSYSSLLLLKKE